MAIQILTDEQRRRYARFAGNPSPEQLARHFHLDIADQEIIQTLRGDHNRLGFALMLCSARFLGAFPDNETEVPKSVRATLARQIALEPDAPLSGYFGSRRRDRHSDGLANLRISRLAGPNISSEFNLFRERQRVVELDSEITNCALQLAVSEQKLDGSQISGLAVDLRRFCSAH